HCPDIESRLHGLELERGAWHAGPTGHERPGHDGPEQSSARGVLKSLKAAGEGVHETVARRLVGLVALNLEALRVIGDRNEERVRIGALCGLVIECGHRDAQVWAAAVRAACREART